MKSFTIAICLLDEEDNIINKKKISARWSMELEKEIKSIFDVDLKSEAASLILDEIKRELTQEIIEDFIDGNNTFI